MVSQLSEDCWRSRSHKKTFLPRFASDPARLVASVVLPDPPFGLATRTALMLFSRTAPCLSADGLPVFKQDSLVSLRAFPHSATLRLLPVQTSRIVPVEQAAAPSRPMRRDPSTAAVHPASAGSGRPETSAWWNKVPASQVL